MLKTMPPYFKFILRTYLSGLLVFTLFRMLLCWAEFKQVTQIPIDERTSILLQAFFMGFRFDTVISGYLLALPALLLVLFHLGRWTSQWLFKGLYYFLLLVYPLAFAICAMDIPYFQHFFARFNRSAFQWTETPGFMFSMIAQEFSYWWTLLPFLVFWVLFYVLFKKVFRQFLSEQKQVSSSSEQSFSLKNGGLALFFLLLIFAAIRGRTNFKSPIRVGTAFFSNYAFANQLGLNPVFTLIRSQLDQSKQKNQSLRLIDEKQAIHNVQQWQGRTQNDFPNYPIAKKVEADTVASKSNVILIMMESMSAAKMERFGNPKQLTPHLDRLANQGYSFDNIYTAGIHTFNGVYSTLFSYPALLDKHPMNQVNIPQYDGMASVLKKQDYATLYFTTHDDQFDNIGGFLKANDFEQVIAQKDYPAREVKSTLGVPDDYMFRFALPKFNQLHQQGKPFFAAMMTASDHGPYYIPDYFQAKQKDIKQQVVEYADWSIGQLMEAAAKEEWFDQTLFIFIADHGAPLNIRYEMPLNYHHSPLIFYAPKLLGTPHVFPQIGGQIDVFPTAMGILGAPYINNTLGIDLLSEERPFIYFAADRKIGVIDQTHFLTIREDGSHRLYHYRNGDLEDYSLQFPEKVDRMNIYARSNIQAAQWLIEQGKTKVGEK